MEEIYRIANIYYKSCIDIRLFGRKGFLFILLGLPFIIFSIFIVFKFNKLNFDINIFIIVAQITGMAFWLIAKKNYDENLVKRLQAITLSKSNELKDQKIIYLSYLTSKIGNDFFEVLKNIMQIQSINNANRSVSSDHFGYYFLSFIYDPDSKNRILSLFIYFISLIALLTVVKTETTVYVYSMIDQINWHEVLIFFGWSAFFIIFFYIIFILPITMAFGYIISPVMRAFSNQRFLLSYLMSELSKYAFSDKQLAINNSHSS